VYCVTILVKMFKIVDGRYNYNIPVIQVPLYLSIPCKLWRFL